MHSIRPDSIRIEAKNMHAPTVHIGVGQSAVVCDAVESVVVENRNNRKLEWRSGINFMPLVIFNVSLEWPIQI